jgi:hypothetical protein
MYEYILGLALLLGGYVTFSKSMGALDNTPSLLRIRMIGGFSSIALFISGFFIFNWWAPFASFLLAMVLWMLINTIALSSKSFSLIYAFRSHIGMLLGIILCLYGIIS